MKRLSLKRTGMVMVATLMPTIFFQAETGCFGDVGITGTASQFDLIPGVDDSCYEAAQIDSIEDFKELPKNLLTRRYRGVVWGDNDFEKRPRIYYPATSANSVLRIKLTQGGALRAKFLIKTAGDDFEWESFHDYDPFTSGSETIEPLWVDVSDDGSLVYVLAQNFMVSISDADGTLQWRAEPDSDWEFEHFSIFDNHIYVTQFNSVTEENRVQRLGLADGALDSGFTVTMPDSNPDTDRSISRYRAFIPYPGGYAWVAQLAPLLEGEEVYILEAFKSTNFDGNDQLAWGQIIADFGNIRYSTDNLTGEDQILFQGRERNYRHNVYYIRPDDGWVRSYSNNLGSQDSFELHGQGVGLGCPPNSNGDDVFHVYTVSDGTGSSPIARFSLGFNSTHAYILENY